MYTTEQEMNDFLDDYKRSRIIIETSVRAVIKRAMEYERKFAKLFYEFSKEEILQMFSDAHARSVVSLHNWNLILRHASRWMLYKQGKPIDNPYDAIIKDDLRPCIDIDKIDRMMITREQLNEMEGELHNAIDQAILELLYLGVTGEWMRELTYLEPEQVSHTDMCIYFRTGKIVPIDERAYRIIMRACDEEEIMSYGEEMTIYQVRGNGIYKIRCNTLYNNANSKDERDAERRARWLQRRIMLISKYLEVPMTPKSLNASGFLHAMKVNMQQSGIDDYKQYLASEDGRNLAVRYGFKSERYMSIILEKFKRYL